MKRKPKVVIVGSANVDLFFRTKTLPEPGETVVASAFRKSFGGKGANQAVAVAKLGGKAVMVCRVGTDASGEDLIENFKHAGVQTRYIVQDPGSATGMAFVTVDESGENTIVIYSGANCRLEEADIGTAIDEIRTSDVVVTQLEIPLSTVKKVAEISREVNTPFILNPAPVPLQDISDIMRFVDVLCPNQTEAQALTGQRIWGMEDAKRAARQLMQHGVKNVVLTLGSAGALLVRNGKEFHIPSPEVTVRDTTGAGDAFVGALAFSLASGCEILEAVQLSNCAAALSVTKDGTQTGLPTLKEVEELRRNLN